MRHAALAALTLLGLSPALSIAQIVPSGAHAPGVISTANGLPQVNIQKPSGAGVSLNTYSQFDVSRSGAILNNSSVITSTQLAGQITLAAQSDLNLNAGSVESSGVLAAALDSSGNAQQDQQVQQQRDAQQRAATVAAPAVRSDVPAKGEWPDLPVETPCFRIDTFALDVPATLPDDRESVGLVRRLTRRTGPRTASTWRRLTRTCPCRLPLQVSA